VKINIEKREKNTVSLTELKPGEYAKIIDGEYAGCAVLRMDDRAALLTTGGYLILSATQCRKFEHGDVLTLTF
jgi:hypothetical protein